jgi:hypothetical protein
MVKNSYISLSLKMAPIRCPEKSVRICHHTLCNNPEEYSSHIRVHGGGSPKSHPAEFPSNNSHSRPLVDGFPALGLSFTCMLPVAKSLCCHCKRVCVLEGLLGPERLEIATNLVCYFPCSWTSIHPDSDNSLYFCCAISWCHWRLCSTELQTIT